MVFIDFVNVLVAALVAWLAGAVYYMAMAKPWMAAADMSADDIDRSDKTPFIISLVVMVLVAGVLRHVLHVGGVTSISHSVFICAEIGLFVAGGWIFLNNAYEGKPMKLSAINTGYAVLATAIIGLVLALF